MGRIYNILRHHTPAFATLLGYLYDARWAFWSYMRPVRSSPYAQASHRDEGDARKLHPGAEEPLFVGPRLIHTFACYDVWSFL